MMGNISKVSTKDMDRETWLEHRRCGIGGSDAATIVGLNPYSSLLTLWADKTGRLPDKEDNEAMRIGRDLEEYVAQRFCEATGKKVRRENAILYNSDYPYSHANVDRRIVGENAILECKTTNMFNRSDFEGGEIPLYYFCQVQHYLAVTECERAYLAVLVLGKAFYWFEIERDQEQIDALMTAEKEFWGAHVLNDQAPEPNGSEADTATLRAVYPGEFAQEGVREIYSVESTLDELDELNSQIKVLEERAEQRKQTVMQFLGDDLAGECEKYKVSWKPQDRTTLDSKKLKADYPDIASKYSRTTTTRTFRVTKKKGVK